MRFFETVTRSACVTPFLVSLPIFSFIELYCVFLNKTNSSTVKQPAAHQSEGNNVVIIPRNVYIERVNEILTDSTKFRKVQCLKGNSLRVLLKQENEIRIFLKELHCAEKITEYQLKKLWPVGSYPGILLGLPKVHKTLVGRFPKFRPILSAFGTPAYYLANIFGIFLLVSCC